MDSTDQLNIEVLAEELKASPMFQLSLSSLELFHSNFLAWLFETHPSSLKILEIAPPKTCKALREHKHIDLCLEADGRKIAVIENKVKSLPDQDQLKRYDKEANDYEHKILLTLMPANFEVSSVSKTKAWREVTYKSLSEKLRKWQEKETCLSSRDKEFIGAYQKMISALSKLVSAQFGSDSRNKYWFDLDHSDILLSIRFIDTVKKYHGARFRQDVLKRISEDSDLNKYPIGKARDSLQVDEISIFAQARFFNKKPCISVYALKGGKEPHPRIEIEEHQYRRMLGSTWGGDKNPKGKAEKEEREKAVLKHAINVDGFCWLFSDQKQNQSFSVENWEGKQKYKSSMRGLLASYYPGAIYQYIDIADTTGDTGCLPYDKVMDRIIDDLKYGIYLLTDEEWGRYDEKQGQ